MLSSQGDFTPNKASDLHAVPLIAADEFLPETLLDDTTSNMLSSRVDVVPSEAHGTYLSLPLLLMVFALICNFNFCLVYIF
jgi:hypothetical protein